MNKSYLTTILNAFSKCDCGKDHQVALETISIGNDALNELITYLIENDMHHIMVVMDDNTRFALGDSLLTILSNTALNTSYICFHETEVHPDEKHVGDILMTCPIETNVLISVGSGCINDLTRYVSYRLQIPYICVPTAPSVDGFVSTVAAMTYHHMKKTFPAHIPLAIFADTNVLTNAPKDMIAAGFGDIIGKYTSLADWRLSHFITGEYYCEKVSELVVSARDESVSSLKKINEDTNSFTDTLLNALLLSGIAMSFVGNSRPASGSEHHISHFWEMYFMRNGMPDPLHGAKVAIGTIISLRLYHQFQNEFATNTDFHYCAVPDLDWTKKIQSAFGDSADEIIELENTAHKNDISNSKIHINQLRLHQQEILDICSELPSCESIINYLSLLKAPFRPADLNLNYETVYESILYAKEVRDRYTILQLLWDLGILNRYAKDATDYIFSI